MINFLSPPIFEDEDKTLVARHIFILIWTCMAVGWLALSIAIIIPGTIYRWLLVVGVIESVGMILLVLNNNRHTRLVINLLIFAVWAVATGAALTGGGTSSNAMAIYFIVVLMAGLLLSGRAGIITAGLCSLTGLFLVYLEYSGALPVNQVPNTPLTRWIASTICMAIIISLQFLVSRTIKNALTQARRELKERKLSDEALALQEMRLRTILESTADGILATDNAGKVIKANQKFADIWKIPSDLLEKGNDETLQTYVLSQLVDPDAFLKKVQELYASTAAAFDTILFKDGRIMERYSCPLLMDGVINGRVWSFRDITERKKAEDSLKETLESLRKAVGTTIQVMVSAVEARDPYTAGHQIRSADLARAIATDMGLSPEKIEGLRMAGSIHDIGKLSIPAEILSKPTKLSEIEFSLIKEHSRQGYEMLKGVESPWPLAEIVYQHHERMDGSGYPRNLKGEEILIEARILTVSDVVEAMASHRPYRPSLGINAALEEIEKNSGISYDGDVADACLRLFREKGYRLAEA